MATPMGPTAVSGTGILVTTRLFLVSITETESENSFPTYAYERFQYSSDSFCARDCPAARSKIANASSEPTREKKPLAAKQKTFILPLSFNLFSSGAIIAPNLGPRQRKF